MPSPPDKTLPTAYLFGKSAPLALSTQKQIKDALNVTHIFHDSSPSSIGRLQALLRDPEEPTPDYIFTGLGFTPEEFELNRGVVGAEEVAYVYGSSGNWVAPAGRVGPPPLDEVVERMREGLKLYEKLPGGGKGKSWTWWWDGVVEEYKV